MARSRMISGMSYAADVGTAHARRGEERAAATSRSAAVRRAYECRRADPVTDKPVYLRETVRRTDEAVRRTARRTLNPALVVEAEKVHWPSPVMSLEYVIDGSACMTDCSPTPTSCCSAALYLDILELNRGNRTTGQNIVELNRAALTMHAPADAQPTDGSTWRESAKARWIGTCREHDHE